MSHPLPPHAHPALLIQPAVPHSLSMHKELNCLFTSNATMVFLPDDHSLDTNITVANITSLTIRGSLPQVT